MMNDMRSQAELYEGLSKEFWGILHFEMPLHSLYNFLQIESHQVTLSRFVDWIVFPHKISLSIANEMYEKLQSRLDNFDYITLLGKEVDSREQSDSHALVMELLYIKSSDDDINTTRLHAIFDLPIQAFFSISLQFVERGYCSSETMMKVYMKYNYLTREGKEHDRKNPS